MQRPWKLSPSWRFEPQTCLTFAPLAWLKLHYFCHAGHTEIGGFAIAAADDLLYIEDFVTVRQQVTPMTVRFADEAVADFFDRCVDQGLSPDRFARVWCHTHPGASVTPSTTDEETFVRSFGRCDWSVMFILGRTGKTYARLAFAVGPGARLELPVAVDWSVWPDSLALPDEPLGAQVERWQQEYAAHIQRIPEPLDPFADVALREPHLEVDGWHQYGWCPELDLVTYEPVKEDLEHARTHKSRVA